VKLPFCYKNVGHHSEGPDAKSDVLPASDAILGPGYTGNQ